MNAFLELDFADRQLGCKAVQAAMGLDAASVEKDFWVCWTLRELFALPGVGGHLTLAWLGGGSAREDKVFSPAERSAFLEKPVVIEEKVDGANIGISVSPSGEIRVQNRGQYIQLPSPGRPRHDFWYAVLHPCFPRRLASQRLFGRELKFALWQAVKVRGKRMRCPNPENRADCWGLITYEQAEVDHRKAYSRGGATSLANAQLLCKSCNCAKSGK
jgi:5-methylcytosine-specific restriction endonuclease McrA